MHDEHEVRNRRFLELLEPIHDRLARHAVFLERGDPDEGADVFAEAVLRALNGFHTLRDPERFAPWFYRILVHVSWRRRRAWWRRLLPIGTPGVPEPNHEDLAADGREVARIEAGELLLKLLAPLPQAQREAFLLHEIEGFDVSEVARLQGVGISAAKSRVARARRTLRARYARLVQGSAATKEVRSGAMQKCASD